MASIEEVRGQVRSRYAAAALAVARLGSCDCGGSGCCAEDSGPCSADALEQDSVFGVGRYGALEQSEVPEEARLASLGCGNPVAVVDLHAGETVLDLGSGGGIDVLLSARRVGPEGFAYGVDMTEEMVQLARTNAARAGATNVEFLQGTIEQVPLPDAAVDVVISNCVVNLSADKPAVLAEMFRVLRPGGRVGISDVVAEDQLSTAERAQRGSFSGCIAGALSRSEYLDGLGAAGFVDATVRFTREAEPQVHAAIIQATKPASGTAAEDGCCQPEAVDGCCHDSAGPCCGATVEGTGSTACGCR